MDRAATSEVKRWKVVQPSIGVPGPACNWAVDDRSPAESEDHGGHDATTLEATTDNEDDCANAEKHLVEAEDDLREEDRAGRGSGNDVLHAKVCEVTNERVRRARVGQRITPEHPLEADPAFDQQTDLFHLLHPVYLHSSDCERLKQQGERRLAARQTTVKETDTGDDEPDEEATDYQIDVVELEAGILGVDILIQ